MSAADDDRAGTKRADAARDRAEPRPAPANAPIANAPAGPQPAGLDHTRRPQATPDRTIHMIGNAHIDPVWLWPWQEGYQEARATFASACDRMDEYDDFIFTCDQMVLLSWVEESDPALFERIKRRVAEGRWVNAGGWWVEPDCNMPMGESFVRQGLYGQRYLASRFGAPATVGMNVDPFGHNVMLPQILRGQGLDSYMFLRPGPHESDFGSSLFWWQAPDGSRVLAYRIPFEYGSPAGSVEGQTEKSLAALDRGLGDVMVFYGVGNHGGGPTKANIESIHRYDRMGSFGRMTMSSPRTYFDEVLARGDAALASLPVRTDDLQHHAAGCYSAHSGIKAWQKRAQHAVLSAERWAAITAVHDDIAYPRDELATAWKQVLFNQFHDVLPGSAIEPSYDDARDQLGEAISIAKRIIVRAHNVLARQIDVPFDEGTQPVVVFNPHPWPVSTDVEMQYGGQRAGVHVVDDEGRMVVYQRTQSTATTDDQSRGAVVFRADVPALGYRLFRIKPGAMPLPEPTALQVRAASTGDAAHVLENDLVRIELDAATGWISSYLDKQTGVDVMACVDGASHTQVCDDPTDTWGHRVVSYAWPGASMTLGRIVVRETGPLRARVRVERAWGASALTEEFVLDHDSRVLRVNVTLDWREHAHLLKLRFPTVLETPSATYEVPFGHLARPVDGAEEPAQSWVDLTGTVDGAPAGLTVVTTNKHAYDVSPSSPGGASEGSAAQPSVGVTAVRSPVYSWHDPRLLDADGVYSYQDQGIQRFSYELVPHAGDWRTADPTRRAALLGSPVRAMQEPSHPGTLPPSHSFASDGGDAVMITALKGSEDPTDAAGTGSADLIVRAVETRGEAASTRIELPVVDRVLEESFGPSQIRTFRVPKDPALPVVEVDLIEWVLGEK
ncbi:alpha-mannosidase [Microbacterium sp. STN6]|uniref:alpha-mannosidase n=1 Tax=Microbacterium sp. STN6 TaxID=2995588 RepID=UPI0022609280|nr:alpha-mannosidase [Microbacterium sp. STN6]MCX7522840.1 alpha-mannosidase [Microbacterium sp. STN6]